MPGYVERNGILHFKEMANKLIYDLQRFGFVIKNTDTKNFVNFTEGEILEDIASSEYKKVLPKYTIAATLESATAVDPLATTQPWRLRIDANCDFDSTTSTECTVTTGDPGFMRVFAGHALQITDTGKVSQEFLGVDVTKNKPRYAGELTCGFLDDIGLWGGGISGDTFGKRTIPFASAKFDDKAGTVSKPWNYGDIGAHPYSYMLSVSDRGVAFVCWQEAQDDYGDRFSWFVIQRPVNPDTGATLADAVGSKCPVFCIYSIGGGKPDDIVSLQKMYDASTAGGNVYANLITNLKNPETNVNESPYDIPRIYRFTVRESDVFRPTTPVIATVDSPDNRAVINGKQQVAIAEDGKYVIFYPNGFNTDRYMYREEVDTLVYTSADVISQWQEVNLTPYPNKQRTYKACLANITNNRGMRILIMVEQPGVIVRGSLDTWIDPPIV